MTSAIESLSKGKGKLLRSWTTSTQSVLILSTPTKPSNFFLPHPRFSFIRHFKNNFNKLLTITCLCAILYTLLTIICKGKCMSNPKESTETSTFYKCPNGCNEPLFTQAGTNISIQDLDEDGNVIGENKLEFTPTGKVECGHCHTEAIVLTKTIRTIVTIE